MNEVTSRTKQIRGKNQRGPTTIGLWAYYFDYYYYFLTMTLALMRGSLKRCPETYFFTNSSISFLDPTILLLSTYSRLQGALSLQSFSITKGAPPTLIEWNSKLVIETSKRKTGTATGKNEPKNTYLQWKQ